MEIHETQFLTERADMTRRYVCQDCIEDEDLKAIIFKNRSSHRCDYCETSSEHPIACDLKLVIEHMWYVIEQSYKVSPTHVHKRWLPVQNVLFDLQFDLKNYLLLDDLNREFSTKKIFNESFYVGDEHENHFNEWERFKWLVTYYRRFTFATMTADNRDKVLPSTIMSTVTEAIHHIDLTIAVGVGIKFWRVRKDDGRSALDDESDFTPPPKEYAKSPNRMSPSGISMFYGADTFETAVAETIEEGEKAVGICFQTLVPLNLLDLTNIPRVRMWSDMPRKDRQAIMFLEKFREDMSKKVERDHSVQHIEYVPTQIFTEYIRFEVKTPEGEPYHGIRYPSSITGDPCYVLFFDEFECRKFPFSTNRVQYMQPLMATRTST